jgi:hypothetical protein
VRRFTIISHTIVLTAMSSGKLTEDNRGGSNTILHVFNIKDEISINIIEGGLYDSLWVKSQIYYEISYLTFLKIEYC